MYITVYAAAHVYCISNKASTCTAFKASNICSTSYLRYPDIYFGSYSALLDDRWFEQID